MNVFELFGTIGLKDDGLEKGINGAIGKAKSFSAKFTDIITTAGKTAAVGLGAAATAFTGFTTLAVKSYADYEQLIGGVETLFSDSSGIIEKYATSAYRTANMSANDYMETITGFSASLLQGLGGDTKRAAEIGNLAVTDMADNANKMGTSIEMIQNAYQGFAKDNFTMLDNLKLGYGGTAGEMARLVNESGVLGDSFVATAENVKDIPFDQLITAIHKVQTEMGITGTTSKEASETISGSWNTLKASWTNVLTGMASDNKEFLVESISALASSAGDFAGNIMTSVSNVIDNITERLPSLFASLEPMLPLLFEKLLPAVTNGAITLMTGLVGGMVENLPMILSTGEQIIQMLVKGIVGENKQVSTALDSVFGAFDKVFSSISESGLIQNIIDLLATIGDKALEITPFIANVFSDTLTGLIQGVSDAVGFLAGNFDTILEVIVPLTTAFVTYKAAVGIVGIIDAFRDAMKKATLVTQAAEFAQKILNTTMLNNPFILIATLVAALVTWLIYLWNTNDDFRKAVIDAWEAIKAAADKVWGAIVKFFTEDIPDAIDKMVTWFKELPQSIGDALSAAIDRVSDWVSSLIETVTTEIPKIINSVVSFFDELPYKIGYAIGFAIGTLIEWVSSLMETISTEVPKVIENVVKFFQELPGKIYDQIVKTKDKVVAWATSLIETAKTEIPKFVNAVIDYFAAIPGKLYAELIKAKDKVVEWATNLVDTAKTEIPKFFNQIIDGVKELPQRFMEIGGNIVSGLVNGVADSIGGAVKSVTGFFDGIVDGVKKSLRINSPSKVFSSIGKSISEGAAEGIESGEKTVESSIKELTGAILAETHSLIPQISDLLAVFKQLWIDTFTEINNEVSSLLKVIKQDLFLFMSAMLRELDATLKDMARIAGVNMMLGLLNGMSSMESRVLDKARAIANAIRATIQAALDIHSPSGVMKKIGGFIGEGLIEGMDNTISGIIAASNRMSDAVGLRNNSANLEVSTTSRNAQLSQDVASAPNIYNLYVQTVPQTPSELMSAARANFDTARWAL